MYENKECHKEEERKCYLLKMQKFMHRSMLEKGSFSMWGKIECMEDKIEDFPIACEVIDAEERILTPGFIDQHVHVTGGGGKEAFIPVHRNFSCQNW